MPPCFVQSRYAEVHICIRNRGGFIMPKNYKLIAQLKRKEVSNRKIALLLGISRNTVNRIVKDIMNSGIPFYDVSEMDETEIKKKFKKDTQDSRMNNYVQPDYESLKNQLTKPGVTLQLLWEEYIDTCRLSGQKGYQLTQFKKHFNEYLSKIEFKDILKHKAGERIEVDWAGVQPYWTDPDTGEIIYGYLFGGVLSFSGYGYVQITTDMKMENWIDCHVNMLKYFGGASQLLTPDNLKTGITKNTKDELIINKTYQDMATYYGMIVIPGRVRKPRDKNKVENFMLRMEQNIIGRLRERQFFSIEEYNQAVLEELDKFNNRPFQKKEGSRRELFEKYEKHLLQPLPYKPYEFAKFKKAKVQSNSHIVYQKNYYSVPYEYIGKEVDLKIAKNQIAIYYANNELCTHDLIKNRIGLYKTETNHMPPNSNSYGEWNSTRYLNWAKNKGPYVYQVIYRIFQNTKTEQRYYRTVHSILKLADKYTNERLNKSCQLALKEISIPMYRDIKFILETKQDLCQEDTEDEVGITFRRGGDYFE